MGSKPPPLLRAPLSPSKLHSIAIVGKYDWLAHFRVSILPYLLMSTRLL